MANLFSPGVFSRGSCKRIIDAVGMSRDKAHRKQPLQNLERNLLISISPHFVDYVNDAIVKLCNLNPFMTLVLEQITRRLK